MPDWGNVDGTVPGRVSKMSVDSVVDEWVSEDDLVVEVGPSKGYTSCEIANISGAEVVGVDVPEAYSRGVADNEYGEGPNPDFVAGVTPIMPIQDGAIDGVVAFNSVTYLCRNIGSMMAEPNEEAVMNDYVEEAAADILKDFSRVTGDEGYVILGEQTDQSYLVLQKNDRMESGRL